MSILVTMAIALGVYLATEAVEYICHWLFCRRIEVDPSWLEDVPLTDEDNELIQKNRDLLQSLLKNNDIASTMSSLSIEERVDLLVKIIQGAINNYNVNIDSIRFSPSSEIGEFTLGYYDVEQNRIMINLDYLASDTPDALRRIVRTIFHELRHAQQYRAITDVDYNYGTEDQRKHWSLNFVNYISPDVDFQDYSDQTIERDARAVAENSCYGF